MAPNKRETGRLCAVCGRRGGSTQGYATALRWAGLLKDRSDPDYNDKAHAACIAKLGAIATERVN